MKSKRRHELQTNDLADRIGHFIERVRPYVTTALAVLVAFAVVVSVWYYMAANHERKMADAWRAYFSAGTDPTADLTAQLSEVADSYANTSAGLWAAQTAADFSLAQGVQMMFSDRAEAETNIDKAKGLYKQVLDNKLTKSNPMLLERARFGLAQAYETLSELDDARKYYQLVVDTSSGSPLEETAKKRLETLAKPDVEKWYNWFARQEPAPPQPSTPATGAPLGGSPLGGGMPSLSGLSDMPEEDVTAKPKADASKPAPSADVTNEPAATDKPDASKNGSSAAAVPAQPEKTSPAAGTKDVPKKTESGKEPDKEK